MPLAATSARKALHLVGIALFLVCLCLPATDTIWHLSPPVGLMENDPTPLPPFCLSQAFKSFNVLQRGYLEKTFGFRKLLVRYQNILDLFVLDASTQYQSVLKGKGNWLFLAQENGELNVVEDFRATQLFTPIQIARWVAVYKDRRDWLAAQGIRYLVVVAPNKHTVYPEHLPEKYNRISSVTRTDQLVNALDAAGVEVVDLRPSMLRIKKDALAYYRTDTHWTTFGAFTGYVEIMLRLAKWFPSFASALRADFDIEVTPGLSGGLAAMLALGDLFPEDRVTFIPKTPRRAVEVPDTVAPPVLFQPTVVMETGDASLPSLVMFRDSFAHELIPFLAEHFNRSVYLWPYPSTPRETRGFDRAAIESLKPDLVIDEFVERYFTEFPVRPKPQTPPTP